MAWFHLEKFQNFLKPAKNACLGMAQLLAAQKFVPFNLGKAQTGNVYQI